MQYCRYVLPTGLEKWSHYRVENAGSKWLLLIHQAIFNLMAFQVYWWLMLFHLWIYSPCPYAFIHVHTTNYFSTGRVVYKFLLSIWQTFTFILDILYPLYLHLPIPSSQGEESTARRLVNVEPRSLPFRPCSKSQSPWISWPNGPSPFPEPGWVSSLVHPPRPGMRGDQKTGGHAGWDVHKAIWDGPGVGKEERIEGVLPYTILPALPCLVQNSEEPKNSKLEPDYPGHVEGIYVERGWKNIFHLNVINQVIKQLNTKTSFVDLHFILLPHKC